MSVRIDLPLAALSARRTLHPGVLALFAVAGLLVARHDFSPALAQLSDPGGTLGRGLDRSGTWLVLALCTAPVLVSRAAGTIARWRARDANWLACRALDATSVLLSTWLGIALACALVALAALALVEARVGNAGPSLRAAGTLAGPPPGWIDGRTPRAWRVTDPGARAGDGSCASLELGLGAGAGPTAEVVFACARDGARTVSRAHIATRGRVEVALPPGRGDLDFALAVSDPAARVLVLDEALELWSPIDGERAVSLALGARALLALAAWTALALGLGAWMSAPTAAATIAAAWLALWLAGRPPEWIPGADWFDALAITARGRAPALPSASSVAAAAACAVVGLALARVGLRDWSNAA